MSRHHNRDGAIGFGAGDASRVKSDPKLMWRIWMMRLVGMGFFAYICYLGALRAGWQPPF